MSDREMVSIARTCVLHKDQLLLTPPSPAVSVRPHSPAPRREAPPIPGAREVGPATWCARPGARSALWAGPPRGGGCGAARSARAAAGEWRGRGMTGTVTGCGSVPACGGGGRAPARCSCPAPRSGAAATRAGVWRPWDNADGRFVAYASGVSFQ